MRILNVREAAARLGVSRATLYRMVRAHEFPRPVRVTARHVGFLESEVDDWIAERARTERVLYAPLPASDWPRHAPRAAR